MLARATRWPYFLILGIVGSFLLDGAVCGAEVKISPLVILKQEYTDNLFFNEHGKEDDWITTTGGGLKASARTERLNASAEGRAESS